LYRVEACGGTGIGHRPFAENMRPSRHTLATLILVIATADACLMPDGSNDQDYKDYGAAFEAGRRALWMKMTSSSGDVAIATATPINRWYVLTSAHAVTGVFSGRTYEVGTGTNFTNPTSTISVASVLIYPGYDGTRNGPDIAILRLATPLPNFQPVTIGSAEPGDVVAAAGYGFAFRPSDPIPTSRDGFIRAWNGPVIAGAPSQSSDVFYDRTLFGSSSGYPNGKLLGGDSGGPVYSLSGELIGLNTAQSGNADPVGTSI
jgi:hypothetical protein